MGWAHATTGAADAKRSEPARYDSGKYHTVAVIVAGKTRDKS